MVDGHNVFNDLGRIVEGDRQRLLAYVRDWFDLDRLVNASLGQDVRLNPWQDLGVVVFHSRKRLGDQGAVYSLGGEDAQRFWARQGAAANTAAMLVEVPGAPSGKDVGMDISIVVYLFETAERWDAGVLFTNDSDFAPAVWSLRRKGKRIYCSSPSTNRASPLVQACQNFLPWDDQFLRADRDLFEFLLPGGAFDTFLDDPRMKPYRPSVISFLGAGLRLQTTVNDVVQGALRDALERHGIHHLYASSGGGLVIQAQDPKRVGQALAHGNLVFEGIRRHPELFKDAGWISAYRE